MDDETKDHSAPVRWFPDPAQLEELRERKRSLPPFDVLLTRQQLIGKGYATHEDSALLAKWCAAYVNVYVNVFKARELNETAYGSVAPVRFEQREILPTQQPRDQSAFLIVKGLVYISRKSAVHPDRTVFAGFYGPGSFIGYERARADVLSFYTLRACGQVDALCFPEHSIPLPRPGDSYLSDVVFRGLLWDSFAMLQRAEIYSEAEVIGRLSLIFLLIAECLGEPLAQVLSYELEQGLVKSYSPFCPRTEHELPWLRRGDLAEFVDTSEVSLRKELDALRAMGAIEIVPAYKGKGHPERPRHDWFIIKDVLLLRTFLWNNLLKVVSPPPEGTITPP